MARLDCEQHMIAVQRAEAALEAAKASYEFNQLQLDNARQLSTKRNISREELDKRTTDERRSAAEMQRLEAALREARLSEDKCAIKAPFNAVVIERIASLGDYLVPGSPVVRLLDDESIEISAKVQEQDLESLIGSPGADLRQPKQTLSR